MLANIPNGDTRRHLHEIDLLSESATIDQQHDYQLIRGPFSVFRCVTSRQTLDVGSLQASWSDIDEVLSYIPDIMVEVGTDNSKYDVIPIEPEIPCSTAVPQSPSRLLDSISTSAFDQWVENENPLNEYEHLDQRMGSPSGLFALDTIGLHDPVPQTAPFLLKHYHESVIESFTPIKSAKSPWHNLFFPLAKDALATLMLNKNPDHANLSIVYATLSISAFSYRVHAGSQHWHQLANFYGLKAQGYLQRGWLDAFTAFKKFKYKSFVMALLVMIQVSVSNASRGVQKISAH